MTTSHTAYILEQMETYTGPIEGAPAPDPLALDAAAREIMHILDGVLQGRHMEERAAGLLWQIVNVFHREGESLALRLDAHILRLRELQAEQDGSEVKSVDLENALAEAHLLESRSDAMREMREAAADQFSTITGETWLPRSGSRTRANAVTASVIDARDFARGRTLQKAALYIPKGKRIVIAPGATQNHEKIWAVLDGMQARAKREENPLVLLHGGGKGAELIAAKWAETRQVPQVVFKPDWKRHGKAAPFKRNDAMIAEVPHGVLVFAPDEEVGIQQQLIRKAREAGIQVKAIPA